MLDDELLHDEKKVDNVYSVATVVYSNMWWSKQADKSLPVWIYVVSVCVGLFLLLIVVVAFWKVMGTTSLSLCVSFAGSFYFKFFLFKIFFL